MANLALIKEVCFYTGQSNTSADQAIAFTTLSDANIKFASLSYGNDLNGANATFAALNTWTWGANTTIGFDHFPILTWKECYADFTIALNCAIGSANIANCSLITNKALIA